MKNESNQPYSALADYYEIFTEQDCDYVKWSQYLYALLGNAGAIKGCDLACGTGKMTRLLKKGGFDVYGADKSAEMLNAALAQGGGKYVLQRIEDFVPARPLDFVTLVNDGVNYVKKGALGDFFSRVRRGLKNGGVFVFDISSVYKLKNIIGSNVFYRDFDDVTLLWTNSLKKEGVQMELTFFEKQGELYSRRDETHIQYFHEKDDVVRELKNAHFGEILISDNYGEKEADEKSERLTFAAFANCENT